MMEIGQPAPKPAKIGKRDWSALYKRVLKLKYDKSLPLRFSSREEAESFARYIRAPGRPGRALGIGVKQKGDTVYLFRRDEAA